MHPADLFSVPFLDQIGIDLQLLPVMLDSGWKMWHIQFRTSFVGHDLDCVVSIFDQINHPLQNIFWQDKIYLFLGIPDYLLQGIVLLVIGEIIPHISVHPLVIQCEPLPNLLFIYTVQVSGNQTPAGRVSRMPFSPRKLPRLAASSLFTERKRHATCLRFEMQPLSVRPLI